MERIVLTIELKIEMLKALFLLNNNVMIYQVDHSPNVGELILIGNTGNKLYFFHINGFLYDGLKQADTIKDVVNVYESIGFQ